EGISPIEGDRTVESINAKKLRVANALQLRVMRSKCRVEDGKDGFVNWPHLEIDGEQQGGRFRRLFEQAIKDNPDLLNSWDMAEDEIAEEFVRHFPDVPTKEERDIAA
ncbi:MAG: hypothetical protein AAB660_00695, partial [Patescibacteria group bacterium]